MNGPVPTCPDCGLPHDPRPCATEGAQCACCAALFAGPAERAEFCRRTEAQ